MTDTSPRVVTCAHCAGVVDVVCEGDFSVKDGIARLAVFRQVGTSEQRMSAVFALQSLALNPDLWIASAARRVLHERFVDDSWLLFTQYRDAMAQTKREYDEVVTAAQLHVAVAEVATIQRNPVPPEIVSDHADDADADSLESFGPMCNTNSSKSSMLLKVPRRKCKF